MASCSTVIKIKFGDTLRRFNAFIHNEELNFDMVMLRKKICSLFGLTPDDDFTLTYIDEDGDVVTLCDDADLHEVAAQSLDPLRITVRLNTNKLGRSPQDQLPFDIFRISDILKHVPWPLHDALAKFLLDLTSEAASSAPVFAELVEKIQTAYLNEPSESQVGSCSSTDSGTTPEDTMGSSDIKEQQGLKTAGASERSPDTSLGASASKEHKVSGDAEVGSPVSKNKTLQLETVTKDVKFGDVHPPKSAVKKKKDAENISIESPAGVHQKSLGFGASNPDYLKHCLQDSKTTEMSGVRSTKTITATNDSSSSSGWQKGMLSAMNECPFKGIPLSSDSTVHACPYASRVPPFKRSYNHSNNSGSIFHMGIECDGCGVHPIAGPRFKSKVKDDYDLCSICFEDFGFDTDYTRINHPVISPNSPPLKGFHDHIEMESSLSKLDSCFVLDVNIRDGTIMAPSTPFTKIWRMRNNGNITWPKGLRFLWTGGDMLSNGVSVEVEIPADGLPVDQDLDVSVDLVAPELPGMYVSYWSLAFPSGQTFGHHVWVVIQVDDTLKNLDETSINLNLPPVCIDPKDPGVVKSKMDQDGELHENHFIGLMEPEDLFFDAQPHRDQETNFPIKDTSIISNHSVSNTEVPNAVRSPSNLDQESSLLKELEDMGFVHDEFNKFVLKTNKFNLEQSVIDIYRFLERKSGFSS